MALTREWVERQLAWHSYSSEEIDELCRFWLAHQWCVGEPFGWSNGRSFYFGAERPGERTNSPKAKEWFPLYAPLHDPPKETP